MKPRHLGKGGLSVSPLCFGTMHLAGDTHGVSRALLAGLERGITVIDTAQLYGDSEAIIGRTLREWRGARPVIATKVGAMAPQSWQSPVAMERAFPAAHVIASVESSLQALGVDCLDLILSLIHI
jgi:aryl-alcohol dehydrogenase-like predicted oxidoreductase